MDKETRQMFEMLINRLDSIEKSQNEMQASQNEMQASIVKLQASQKSMSLKQDEMYLMQRALEENIKVTRAEQDKMMYIVTDIQGKVTKLTGEVEDHENIIKQIRAIK